MVKPYLCIKLKDPQHYYLEDETIACIIDLRLEKVLKDPLIKVSFKGRSSSHSNGSRHHFETIFTTEKEISITKWNNTESLKKMNEVEFAVEVPNGVTIPSYRNFEGSDGGKIEYMIEASLDTASFLKRSVQATHIIQVPLIGKVNVGDDDLQKPRESSIRWPKHEETANTFVLSAWIPYGGCVRGKDVPIRVELKQPDRFQAPKVILVELIRQEIIASNKDSLPDMTKQLEDKIIQKDEKDVVVVPELGGTRLLSSSQILVISTPSNITPTINKNAKVMRLDYKLRVSVRIPEADSGRDKVLSVNLPIVIGTTGVSTIYDSGFDLSSTPHPYGSYHAGGSEGNNSMSNGFSGGPMSYYPQPINPPSMHGGFGPQQPPIGFHMPDPNFGYPPASQPMYPPNRFVLNPEQLAYNSTPDGDDSSSNKFEKMPMPDFGSISSNNTRPFSPFVSPSTSTTTAANDNMSIRPLSPLYPHPDTTNKAMESAFDQIYATLPSDENNTVTTTSLTPSSSVNSHNTTLAPPKRYPSLNKPNTPTPPQTPAINHQPKGRHMLKSNESSSTYYSSSLVMESNINDTVEPEATATSPSSNERNSLPLRVDPLIPN